MIEKILTKIITEEFKKIILKNNIRFNLYRRLKYWNFDINKQKDGYNIKFENEKYYLYKIDMGMGRAYDFKEAKDKEELVYLIIYRITLTIAESKLMYCGSRLKVFEFQEELLKSVNDKWWESAREYHKKINNFENNDRTFHQFSSRNIKNILLN